MNEALTGNGDAREAVVSSHLQMVIIQRGTCLDHVSKCEREISCTCLVMRLRNIISSFRAQRNDR